MKTLILFMLLLASFCYSYNGNFLNKSLTNSSFAINQMIISGVEFLNAQPIFTEYFYKHLIDNKIIIEKRFYTAKKGGFYSSEYFKKDSIISYDSNVITLYNNCSEYAFPEIYDPTDNALMYYKNIAEGATNQIRFLIELSNDNVIYLFLKQ